MLARLASRRASERLPCSFCTVAYSCGREESGLGRSGEEGRDNTWPELQVGPECLWGGSALLEGRA